MKIVYVSPVYSFATERVQDTEHWRTINDVVVNWMWEHNGSYHNESIKLQAGFKWDGASRPNWIGWLIPRGGVFLLASGVHDFCFKTRPVLSDGSRISRQHTDLLYLAIMRMLAEDRVTSGWKAPAQIILAETMYRFVRWFGEPVWDNHDKEFRA